MFITGSLLKLREMSFIGDERLLSLWDNLLGEYLDGERLALVGLTRGGLPSCVSVVWLD